MRSVKNLNIVILFLLLLSYVFSWCLSRKLQEGTKKVMSIDFSPKISDFIAIGRDDGVYILNQTTFEVKGAIINSGQTVQSVSFSFTGNLFAIGYSNKNYVRIYSTSTFPFTQKGYSPFDIGMRTYGLDFKNDGTILLACGNSNDAKIIYMSNATSVNLGIPFGNSPATQCQYSKGSLVGITFQDRVIIYDTIAKTYKYFAWQNCDGIDFSFTEQAYAGCTAGNLYKILSSTTNILSDSNDIMSVSYSPDGSTLFAGGKGKNTLILNGVSLSLMSNFSSLSTIQCSRFDQLGQTLLVGTTGGYVYIFKKDCKIGCQLKQFFENGTCYSCISYLNNCTQCLNSTNCLSCQPGYYIYNNKCTKCSSPCLNCDLTNTNCTSCQQGYYVDTTTKQCVLCRSTIQYCKSCENSTTCRICDSIAYGSGCSLCQVSLSNCIKCLSSTTCIQCYSGFYLNSTNSCNACNLRCVACVDANICTECVRGYYLNNTAGPYPANNNCIKCTTTNCVHCTSKNICLECAEGKYISSNNCLNCTFPCIKCVNNTKCSSCISGYYVDSITFTCKSCDLTCQTCNASGSCLTCFPGSGLVSTICKICSQTYPSCSNCNSTKCLTCMQGYYLNSTSDCVLCPISNCQSCNSSTICSKCMVGFYHTGLTGNAACKNCKPGCSQCLSATSCQGCLPGYYYASNDCLVCVPPCITCIDNIKCQSCSSGYFYTPSNNTCKQCLFLIPHCLECYNSTYCIGCELGYFLSVPSKSLCQKCPSNCIKCENLTSCLACDNGYYLNTSNVCNLCSDQCQKCQTSTKCQVCNLGYFLLPAFTCSLCNLQNCYTCNSSTSCLKCGSGTYLDTVVGSPTKGQCLKCKSIIPFCHQCNSTINKCLLCQYGYGLNATNTQCIKCSQINGIGCLNCINSNQCLSCFKGFHLSGSVGSQACIPCAQGCEFCDITGLICSSCSSEYYLNNTSNSCMKCDKALNGCRSCYSNLSLIVCTECFKDYYLYSTLVPSFSQICKLCNSAISGCTYCKDNLTCDLCESGYYYDSVSYKCFKCSNSSLLNNACIVCQDKSICLFCEKGFYLDSATKNCSRCTSLSKSCTSCLNQTHCTECQKNTYLDFSTPGFNYCTLCSIALPGCIYCASNTNCLQCDSGYYLNSTYLCQKCSSSGCQLCDPTNPSKCLICDSMFMLNTVANICSSCNNYIQGCLTCTNQTGTQKCTQCNIGYYISPASTCTLCSSTIIGCLKCDSSNICTECQALYLLTKNSTTSQTFCKSCSDLISRCQYCHNSSVCIECERSYFWNTATSSCQFCSQFLPQCLFCDNQTKCMQCIDQYYLDSITQKCLKCSSFILGCNTCSSANSCTSCLNGYSYNSYSKECDKIVVSANEVSFKADGFLKLITYYVSTSSLKHILYSINSYKFNKSASTAFDLTKFIDLTLEDNAQNLYQLNISSVYFSDNEAECIFLTNNPLNLGEYLDKNDSSLPVRRLLALGNLPFQLNIESKISLPKQVANSLIPALDSGDSDIKVNYGLNSPEFYRSVLQQTQYFDHWLLYFGYGVLVVLFINLLIKIFITSLNQNTNIKTEIFSHIIALKTIPLAIYPCYSELFNFGKGFMLFDIPWINFQIPQTFASAADYSPAGFAVFYLNMNFASMYLLSGILILCICAYGFFKYNNTIQTNSKEESYKVNFQNASNSTDSEQTENKNSKHRYFVFWCNIFGLNIIFASVCSLEGALSNAFTQIINLNFLFYLIGSFIFLCITLKLIHYIYKFYQSPNSHLKHSFAKNTISLIRIYFKAILLSLCYISQLYFIIFVVSLDIILIITQYWSFQIETADKEKKEKTQIYIVSPKIEISKKLKYLWIINQFLANITLLICYLFNNHLVGIVLPIIFIVFIVMLEIILHYYQYQLKSINQKDQLLKSHKISNISLPTIPQQDKEASHELFINNNQSFISDSNKQIKDLTKISKIKNRGNIQSGDIQNQNNKNKNESTIQIEDEQLYESKNTHKTPAPSSLRRKVFQKAEPRSLTNLYKIA